MIIQALRKGLIEHEASDTGGVPRWESSCSDRLAEATGHSALREIKVEFDYISRSSWWGCRQLGGLCLFLAAVVLLLCHSLNLLYTATWHTVVPHQTPTVGTRGNSWVGFYCLVAATLRLLCRSFNMLYTATWHISSASPNADSRYVRRQLGWFSFVACC